MQPMKKKARTCTRGHNFEGSDPCPLCWPGYRTFKVRAKVWLYTGKAAWHFVTLPTSDSKEITTRFGAFRRGWGSFPVRVTVGKTVWQTSIFFDTKAEAYVLPLKTSVRREAGITVGDSITLTIEVRV